MTTLPFERAVRLELVWAVSHDLEAVTSHPAKYVAFVIPQVKGIICTHRIMPRLCRKSKHIMPINSELRRRLFDEALHCFPLSSVSSVSLFDTQNDT